MTYTVISYSDSEVKLTEDSREYIYKKVYCSCEAQGDYVVFSTHQIETGILKQQYKFLYTDCSNPSQASADELVTAINAILTGKPLEYIALLTQSGGSAPDATVIRNDIGEVTYNYLTNGTYQVLNDLIADAIANNKLEKWITAGKIPTRGIVDAVISREENILLIESVDRDWNLSDDIISDGDGFFPTVFKIVIHP